MFTTGYYNDIQGGTGKSKTIILHERISGITYPDFTKFVVHATYDSMAWCQVDNLFWSLGSTIKEQRKSVKSKSKKKCRVRRPQNSDEIQRVFYLE